MQIGTLTQTYNHASIPPLSFYRPNALPAAQPTASKRWQHVFSPMLISYVCCITLLRYMHLIWCIALLFAVLLNIYFLHVRPSCSVNLRWYSVSSLLVHTHTHTHTQPFYDSMDFVRDNLGEPVPEETFTHSCLSVIPYLLHPSTTIHGILPIQSTHLTVFFHNLSPSFLWSALWPGTLHTFFHPSLSSFRNTCPYHRNLWNKLFHCSTEIMSSNPSLSFNPLLGILSCCFMPHIHLTILFFAHWSSTSFSFLTARSHSVQHTTSHTTIVQSPSHFQWYPY